jgi:hypothetical protein
LRIPEVWRQHHHTLDTLVVQQLPEIAVSLRVWSSQGRQSLPQTRLMTSLFIVFIENVSRRLRRTPCIGETRTRNRIESTNTIAIILGSDHQSTGRPSNQRGALLPHGLIREGIVG